MHSIARQKCSCVSLSVSVSRLWRIAVIWRNIQWHEASRGLSATDEAVVAVCNANISETVQKTTKVIVHSYEIAYALAIGNSFNDSEWSWMPILLTFNVKKSRNWKLAFGTNIRMKTFPPLIDCVVGAMTCLLAAPWVQLSVSAGNGWPHNALRHHWLMPISSHFRDCKALLVTRVWLM